MTKAAVIKDQVQFKDPNKRDLQLRENFGNIDRQLNSRDVAYAITSGVYLGLGLVGIGFALAWLISIARLR